jgi:hypothetical protein
MGPPLPGGQRQMDRLRRRPQRMTGRFEMKFGSQWPPLWRKQHSNLRRSVGRISPRTNPLRRQMRRAHENASARLAATPAQSADIVRRSETKSSQTPRWREPDSNPRSHLTAAGGTLQ